MVSTGYPLFPGENEVEQLACMMEVLGLPPTSVLENATRKKMFFGMSTDCQFFFLYSSTTINNSLQDDNDKTALRDSTIGHESSFNNE